MYDALPKGNPEITAQKNDETFSIDGDTVDWLRNRKEQCERLNDSDWLNVKRQMLRARNYFDGRQYGDVNPQLQWVDYPKAVGEISYTANVYQGHIQTALTEMSKGNTDLTFSHISGESRKGTLVAKIAEIRYKAHKRRIFDRIKEQQENLNLLLSGVAIRYTYLTDCRHKAKIPKIGRPEIGQPEQAESAKVCAECSAPAVEAKTECPICGSTEFTEISAPPMQTDQVVGYEDVPLKESNWRPVDPVGCTWYLHAATLKDSPYFIWKQAMLTEVVKAKYPDVAIKAGVKSPELNYQAFGESGTPGSRVFGTEESTEKCELALCWFDPPLYAHYVPKQDLKLRRGVIAPAGRPLGETFPNGIFLLFNDRTILDVEGEDKNTKLTVAPYVTRIGTMVGAGTSAALEGQDTKNDLRNLHMQSIYNDAFRKEFVDPMYIDPDQIPADPNERAVLKASPQRGDIVGTVIDALPATSLSSDAYAMEDRIDGESQMQMGTFSGTQNGMPDLKAVQDTAAGMQMWREMTIGRYYPMLSVRADCLDKEQAYQLLENDQKYLSPEQWDKIKGDYSEEAVKEFLNCDLREELVIEVVPESFMPLSTSQKQAGLMGWSRFITETQAPPDSEISGYAANLFNIPKKLVANDAYESMAHIAIDAFKEQADAVVTELGDLDSYDISVENPDPTNRLMAQLILDQAKMPISFKMDDLSVIADTLKDWWATDEGRNATNLLKATILLRMEEIDGAAIAKAQDDQMKAMAAQQPAMEAQAQQQQAQMQQQEAAMQAQAEAEEQKRAEDTEKEAVAKTIDIEQQEAERAYQSQEAEKKRQHEKEMAMLTKKAA